MLPLATEAYLYHTVSGLTLLRYRRLCETYDAPREQRQVVEQMVRLLLEVDPLFEKLLQEPLPLEETPEYAFYEGAGLLEGGGGAARDAWARCVRRGARRSRQPSRRPLGPRGDDPGPGRPGRAGRVAGRALGRRGHRPRPRPGAQRPARRDHERDDALEADARPPPPGVHLPEADLAHRRQPGPAPPDDPGVAPVPPGLPLRRRPTTSRRASSSATSRCVGPTTRAWRRRGTRSGA